MNHFCGLLEAKTISCLTCVVPSIFYICICYCQSILCNPIPLAIKFPCVGWTWETVSLTCQCYALSKFHLCWISRSYSDLLRSIWNKKQHQNKLPIILPWLGEHLLRSTIMYLQTVTWISSWKRSPTKLNHLPLRQVNNRIYKPNSKATRAQLLNMTGQF